MPDLAKQFTKKEIENALDYILDNEIALQPSTKHDLVYKDYLFPPKEVVRWAAKLKNDRDYSNYRLSGGENTNKPLRELGFTILGKDEELDPNLEIISKYKTLLQEGNPTEIYKWELFKKFHGKPDLNAENFENEVNSINYYNLVYHNAIAARKHILINNSSEYKDALVYLFDESIDLKERIVNFQQKIKDIYTTLVQKLGHHHDERTISTFLSFKYPEKYPLYKNSFYKAYCAKLGIKPAVKNEKYIHYMGLIDTFIKEYVLMDDELLQIKQDFLTEDSYQDDNHLLFAQDILYQVLSNNELDFVEEELEEEKDEYKSYVSIMKQPLNQILYGPPGTGKTFELKTRFFDEFTISETSLSREQYLYDIIKPLSWWQVITLSLIELKNAKVVDIHNHEFIKIKESQSSSKTVVPTIWGQLQSHTVDDCPNVNVEKKQAPLYFYKDEQSNWSLNFDLVDELYPEIMDIYNSILNFNPSNNNLIKNYEFVTFHQSYSYEDFIEGIKPDFESEEKEIVYKIEDGVFKRLANKARRDPENKYALFIDEINRGNVSQIFGELITLIEEDKRIGKEVEIEVTLPYSKEKFGVPSNLYIIGTMNTADRSVEALDTALRRRFVFEEMPPKYNLPGLQQKIFDYTASEILETINKRIEKLIDRDHQIGHAYFINKNEETIITSFYKNIIPLFQEYFFGDYGKIGLVLGPGFIEKVEQKTVFAKFNHLDYSQFEEKETFKIINHKDNPEAFKNAIRLLMNR